MDGAKLGDIASAK